MSDEPKTPTVMTWYGRPVTELSREELIDALRVVGTMYHDAAESHIRSLRLLRDLQKARLNGG